MADGVAAHQFSTERSEQSNTLVDLDSELCVRTSASVACMPVHQCPGPSGYYRGLCLAAAFLVAFAPNGASAFSHARSRQHEGTAAAFNSHSGLSMALNGAPLHVSVRRSTQLAPTTFLLNPHAVRSSTASTALFSSETETEVSQTSLPDDEDEWRTLLSAFQMYKAAYGDLKVPRRFIVPAMQPWPEPAWGLKLGQRVSAIRATGKFVNQDEKRRKVLDDVGFLWRLRAPSPNKNMDGISFEQIYDALSSYRQYEINSDAKTFTVPAGFVVPNKEPWAETIRGLPLGEKVPTIRSKAYLKVNPGAVEKLEALGFEIDGKQAANDARYQMVYNALKRYKEINGDLLVPQPFVCPEDTDEWPEEAWGLRLGARVNAIRSQGTFVKNNPDRKEQLEDLGFVWEPPPLDGSKKRGRKKKLIDEALSGPAPPGMLDGEFAPPTPGRNAKETETESGASDMDLGIGAPDEALFGPSSVFGMGEVDQKAVSSWRFDDEDENMAPQTPEEPEDLYRAPVDLRTSLQQAKELAISVGVIKEVPNENRYSKGKIEREIPWFNDDFGADFVFEDVVEALTVYKSIHGSFDALLEDEQFIVPEPFATDDGFGPSTRTNVDIEAAARAAAAIAAAERDGVATKDALIAKEIQRMELEMQTPVNAVNGDGVQTIDGDNLLPVSNQWPEHLAGMVLGNIVKRIRNGCLEVKHLAERKAKLDAIDFDWGNELSWLEIPFEKAMCAMYSYYLIRGDMFVYEDFVMPNDEPWPRALAGYKLGETVKRLRELQEFLEEYHPEKVALLRMVEFVWFPDIAIPIDPNKPILHRDYTYWLGVSHPFFEINMPPIGLREALERDGPWPGPGGAMTYHNFTYVRDVWRGRGVVFPAYALETHGFPQLAKDHKRDYPEDADPFYVLQWMTNKFDNSTDLDFDEFQNLLVDMLDELVDIMGGDSFLAIDEKDDNWFDTGILMFTLDELTKIAKRWDVKGANRMLRDLKKKLIEEDLEYSQELEEADAEGAAAAEGDFESYFDGDQEEEEEEEGDGDRMW